MSLQKYQTNFSLIPSDKYPSPPYKGRGWSVDFGSDVDFDHISYSVNGFLCKPKKLVLQATNEESAQNALELIFASYFLYGEDIEFENILDVCRVFRETSINNSKELEFNSPLSNRMGEYQFACLIASRASHRKTLRYAIHKYRLSQLIFYTSVLFLDPSHWYTTKYVYMSPEHQVRCALAIELGYSIIEELGLEIRADTRNPSHIKGEWNPIVKADLELRLVNAGINLEEKAIWIMRDTPTRIERNKPIPVINKAPWAESKIRDGYIEIIDAISRTSWLRSKVCAHRLHEVSESLNFYEVSNIHYLTRRLILERLGLWRPIEYGF